MIYWATKETWLLAIEGHAQLGATRLSPGQAVFLQADHADIEAGADGLKALLAYPGPTVDLDALSERKAAEPDRLSHASSFAPLVPTSPEHTALKQPETPNWQS